MIDRLVAPLEASRQLPMTPEEFVKSNLAGTDSQVLVPSLSQRGSSIEIVDAIADLERLWSGPTGPLRLVTSPKFGCDEMIAILEVLRSIKTPAQDQPIHRRLVALLWRIPYDVAGSIESASEIQQMMLKRVWAGSMNELSRILGTPE